MARRMNLIDENEFAFTWVVDFPMFEYSEEEKRYVAMHHPFTAMRDEDLDKLETDPGHVYAKAYDLVLNGIELGGGSLRIYQPTSSSASLSHRPYAGRSRTEIRLPPPGLRIRCTAPWRPGLRLGPHDHAHAPEKVHPRRHRLPEDAERYRSHERSSVDGRFETAA